MRRKLKQFFCTHDYYKIEPKTLERSERVGNDNNIVATVERKCIKCNKSRYASYIVDIEKDYYKID